MKRNFSAVFTKSRADSFCIKTTDTFLLSTLKTKIRLNFS